MDDDVIKTNRVFAVFFSLFFTLYQFPIVQMMLFSLIGIYTVIDLSKNRSLNFNRKKLVFIIAWFGLFVGYVILSSKWAIGVVDDSKTVTTLVRMLFIGVLIFLYSDSKEKAISVMKAYVFGVVFMCIIVVLFTPPSLYGVEYGTVTFGDIIKQHRNIIGGAAAETILFILLLNRIPNAKFKHYKIIIFFLLFMIIISGSRGSIIELLIFLFVYSLFNLKKRKLYKYIPIILIALIIGVIIMLNISYLREEILDRFIGMFNTITSSGTSDGSVYSRSLLKKVAMELFHMRPMLGTGVDGVVVFLTQHPQYYGYYFRAVYSHCNYTEIAADFGIVGLALWYTPLLIILKKMISKIKNSGIIKYLLCMLITIIFIDTYKIPWGSYPSICSYFCILSLIISFLIDKKEGKN